MSTAEQTIVVGAGPVGAVLAAILARSGRRVVVCESHSSPRATRAVAPGRSSVNLALGWRGLRPLEELGFSEPVREIAIPLYGRMIHAVDGRRTFQAYGSRGEALYCVRRADLTERLIELAAGCGEIDWRFGTACVGVEPRSGRVHLTGRDGRADTVNGDHVFGADGVNSVVRGALAELETFELSRSLLPVGYNEIVLAPDTRADWMRERDALHVWPRGSFVLLAFPNRDRTFTLSLHARLDADEGRRLLASGRDVAHVLESACPDVPFGPVRAANRLLAKTPNRIATVSCDPWSYARATVIGDAAHAIAPYLGQGVSASFEDCIALERHLDAESGDWDVALARFAAERQPETALLAVLAERHFEELSAGVGDPGVRARRRVEQLLHAVDPERFGTLHWWVCFGSGSYADAVRRQAEETELVDAIVAKTPDVDRLTVDDVRGLLAAARWAYSPGDASGERLTPVEPG